MVHAKNYETVSTFVEVMQRKLWPLFLGTVYKLFAKSIGNKTSSFLIAE